MLNCDVRAALKDEARREIARRDFKEYCAFVDPAYDTESAHIRFLIDLLERIERGEPEKAIITLMPRSGKSALLCKFAAFWLGRNTNKSLLLLSASQNLAVRNSRWIRNQIVESGRYPWDVTIDETSSSVLSWRTNTGNEVRAFSVGSVITGQGGHLILCDDIQPDAMSIATRDALETWLRGVLEGRREPNAPLVVLQNRWSTDDIVARLLDGDDGDTYEAINLKALAVEGENDPLGREPGESIWPSKWPVPLLEKKKRAVGTHVWSSSYQGEPQPEGGRLIPVSLFKEFDRIPSREPAAENWNPLWLSYVSPLEYAKPVENDYVKVTGIDTSGVATTTASGSWSAWTTCMLDVKTGDIFVIAMERARGIAFEELRTRVVAHLSMHNSDLCVIENMAQGGRLGESIRGMTRTPVQLVEARQSKEQRVINILPLLEGGKLYVPRVAAWKADFLRELGDFPASRTNDIVDSWCYATTYCKLALQRRYGDELFWSQIAALESGVLGR